MSNSAKSNHRYHQQKPLALVSLDTGDSIKSITIYHQDDIQEVVERFCEANNFGEEAMEYLYEEICSQINEKSKENVNPPSFGKRDEYMLESFGNPNPREPTSNQTTNQSLSEKEHDQHQAATNYEKWQKLIKENAGSGRKSPKMGGMGQLPQSAQNFLRQNTIKPKQMSQPNIFNKLYEDGLKQYKQREEMKQQNMKQKQECEMRTATFRPEISHKSKVLAQQSRGRVQMPKKPTYQPAQFPHRPSLSPNTQQIASNKSRSNTPVHQKLYTEGIQTERLKQQWAQDEFKERHPFQTESSAQRRPLTHRQQQETIKRLLSDKDRKSKQQTPKSPSRVDTTQNSRIHRDEFHSQVSYKVDQQDKMLANYLSSIRMSPLSIGHTRNNTIQIHDFESVARKIFDALDDDRDGLISTEKCNIQDIPPQVLNILQGLLFEMEDNNLILTQTTFREVCLQMGISEPLVKEFSIPKPYKSLF